MNKFYKNQKAGVAILFAILLVSIVLTVGLTLLNITLRQLVLSSLARESQFAFYAADSARNCARYYDSLENPDERPFGYFTLENNLLTFRGNGLRSVSCGDFTIGINSADTTSTYNFGGTFDSGEKVTCAYVEVTKGVDPGTLNPLTNLPLGVGKTLIRAWGYNNFQQSGEGTAACYITSDRTVERASTMIY
ncbi:MAG: hypothetical protein AAB364_02095 [Patescibacteria group bacterium]